jgi:hypothetical protein
MLLRHQPPVLHRQKRLPVLRLYCHLLPFQVLLWHPHFLPSLGRLLHPHLHWLPGEWLVLVREWVVLVGVYSLLLFVLGDFLGVGFSVVPENRIPGVLLSVTYFPLSRLGYQFSPELYCHFVVQHELIHVPVIPVLADYPVDILPV